jgi:hypothetical protein
MPGLTEEIAEQAIDLARPLIEHLLSQAITESPHLYVVVALRDTTPSPQEYGVRAVASFGDRRDWAYNYEEIAYGKTMITARTGLPSRLVQTMQPELLVPTDVMWWGNAIFGDIIVSCSGVQPWFDEAIANAIAGLCRALIQEELEGMKKGAKGDTYDS